MNDVWIFARVTVRADAATAKVNVADEFAAASEIARGHRAAEREGERRSVRPANRPQ